MKIAHLAGVLVLLSSAAAADWSIEQSPDGHWITTRNEEQHQFILGGPGDDMQFLLIIAAEEAGTTFPEEVTYSVDRGVRRTVPITILDRNQGGTILRVHVDAANKADLIRRMIRGLKLRLAFSDPGSDASRTVEFSLNGFTVMYNELLIANEAGRLDPGWLIEQNRERELICYYIANLSVQALQNRIKGLAVQQNLAALPRTGMEPVDGSLPEIVTWVHGLERGDLPREPRAEKYGLFKRCMDGLAIEG